MQSQRRRTSLLFSLLLVQVLSPLTMADNATLSYNAETNADLEQLQQLGIGATVTAEYGWMNAEDGADVAHLRFRDVTMVAPSEWTDRTGETSVTGFHLLSHAYPVPPSGSANWQQQVLNAISFLPPTSFHCDVSGQSPAQLEALDVQAIAVMDGVDKIDSDPHARPVGP